jgi:hypothetical protein
MIRVRMIGALTLALLLSAAPSLRADVRADEKSRVEFAGMLGRMFNVFGGKAAREGVTSTVAVKGDRKATLNDTTGQIIDLNEEKVYDLDLKKKSYTVTTFDELRRRMEEARKKAEEQASQASKEERKEGSKDQPKEKTAPPPDANQKQVEVDFDLKNTGQQRAINGFDTHETVMTITVREKGKTLEQGGGLVLTSDLWMAPRIPAMKDVAEFDARYAQKLYGGGFSGVSAAQMATMMAMYPMMKDAVAKMNAEGGKLEGTAIQTTLTADAVKSAEQIAEETKAKTKEDESKAAPPATPGGLLGGFAKKMAQKKMAGDSDVKPRATFMTATTEVLKVTTDVTAADVAIPPGFQAK